LLLQALERELRVQVELVQQEIIGMHRRQVERFESRDREVLEIERHDDLGPRPHRGGQHMTILQIVRHGGHQSFIAADFSVREGLPHPADPPIDGRRRRSPPR
jgi:hypothetical protein